MDLSRGLICVLQKARYYINADSKLDLQEERKKDIKWIGMPKEIDEQLENCIINVARLGEFWIVKI